jgi:DNA-directed RNA polymerase subunit RPC12/RpoP
MIFFGSKGKTISGQVVEGIQCPNCESQEFITFGIIRYFHLYWIPTLITSKAVGIECTHCKRTLIDKELPEDLSKDIKGTVFNKKNTIPMFSGLIIIAVLALFVTYSVQQDGIQEAAYIEQPTINDLYVVDFTKIFTDTDPKYKYGLMRIKQISSGQVMFEVSQIAYNKTSGVRKDIRERKTSSDSYYDSEPFYIDISKLKAMKDTRAIKSIERI